MSDLVHLLGLMEGHANLINDARTRVALAQHRVVIVPSTRTPGGAEVMEVPLLEMLETNWTCEACFVPYYTKPPIFVTQAMPLPSDLSFSLLAFDIDRKPKRPMTWELWLRALANSFAYDAAPQSAEGKQGPQPNIMYATRCGIRCIFLTKPFSDAAAYKAAWKRRASALRHMMPATDWLLDETSAWNHLFRAPHVIYEKDGVKVNLHNSPIWLWHLRRSIVKRVASAKKPKRQITKNPRTDAARRWLETVPGLEGTDGSLELDRRTIWIACELMARYGLDASTAHAFLCEWNTEKCEGVWTEPQLWHKVSYALKRVKAKR